MRTDVPRFEDIYREHSQRLFNLAWRMCGTRSDAEDVLQETFLLVYRKLPQFRGQSTMSTWLYRIAVNRCLDHLKSAGTRASRVAVDFDETRLLSASSPRSGLVIDKIDLERAIARLPDRARAAFLLHDVEGFQHNEIAEILGISEGTSKSQVHNARLRVRAELTAELRGVHDVR